MIRELSNLGATKSQEGRECLLRSGLFAQPAHALLQLLAQRGRRIRIERDEIQQWLRAIATEARERSSVAIRMPRDVFAYRRVRMM